MDERQQRGLMIAATTRIEQRAGAWVVPSQAGNGRYAVTIKGSEQFCSCPDFELRNQPCKHIFAVQYVLFRETKTETAPDGTVTTTTTETSAVKVTYGQPSWPAYNAAQCSEKDHFLRLLRDLVATVETPEQKGSGNRRVALSDAIFAATLKVYSGFSGRRFMCDLRAARDNGFTDRAISYNALFDAMQLQEITPILHDMIAATSTPLAALETQFAIDSTGIGIDAFYNHYSAKYGKDRTRKDFLKLHASVGTRTNVIASVQITGHEGADTTQFKPLLTDTARNFNVEEMSADKAYSTYDNLELAESLGVKPFVPFKHNATAVARTKGRQTPKTWTKLYHFFQLHREEFLEHYHRRSNSETTFSMLKRVIGDTLRSKTPIAQTNECLLMVVCHNIRCLIHEAYELGITPMLEEFTCPPMTEVARRLLPAK